MKTRAVNWFETRDEIQQILTHYVQFRVIKSCVLFKPEIYDRWTISFHLVRIFDSTWHYIWIYLIDILYLSKEVQHWRSGGYLNKTIFFSELFYKLSRQNLPIPSYRWILLANLIRRKLCAVFVSVLSASQSSSTYFRRKKIHFNLSTPMNSLQKESEKKTKSKTGIILVTP